MCIFDLTQISVGGASPAICYYFQSHMMRMSHSLGRIVWTVPFSFVTYYLSSCFIPALSLDPPLAKPYALEENQWETIPPKINFPNTLSNKILSDSNRFKSQQITPGKPLDLGYFKYPTLQSMHTILNLCGGHTSCPSLTRYQLPLCLSLCVITNNPASWQYHFVKFPYYR